MKKLVKLVFVIGAIICCCISCTKEQENLGLLSIEAYYPLAEGKTYLYRLDSTVPVSFGSALVVKSYQAKDSVESSFQDNEGRKSYRIFRLLRDTAGKQPWQFAATYYATISNKKLEYVDNNLRFIKLVEPVTDGYSWKGNAFIDTRSLNTPVNYLDEWQYEYGQVDEPYTIFGTRYDSTITVNQQDETTPPGPFNPANYQQRNLGVEVYAKGVGLVYKEFLHWTWQTSPPPAKYEDGSFGVKLRLISHN